MSKGKWIYAIHFMVIVFDLVSPICERLDGWSGPEGGAEWN